MTSTRKKYNSHSFSRTKKPLPQQERRFIDVFQSFVNEIKIKSQKKSKFNERKGYILPEKDNSFLFQIFGVGVLTVAIVLIFQGFLQSENIPLEAQEETQTVRLLTNFHFNPPSQRLETDSRLRDFSIQTEVQEVSPEIEILKIQQQEALTKQRITHVVEEGENVYTIAAAYNIPPKNLIVQNSLVSPYVLYVGQELVIQQ